MPENPMQDFPLMQRDHPPGTLVEESSLFVMQYQDEDGRWMNWLTPNEDRDAMTRIQVHRLREFPEERRRIMKRVTQVWVDEVEGVGEGETDAETLIARNDENTKSLLEKEDGQQPGA